MQQIGEEVLLLPWTLWVGRPLLSRTAGGASLPRLEDCPGAIHHLREKDLQKIKRPR